MDLFIVSVKIMAGQAEQEPHGIINVLNALQIFVVIVQLLSRVQLFAAPWTAACQASLVAHMVKNPPTMQETQVLLLGWKIPWKREWLPTPVFLPGESPWTEGPGGL